MLKQETDIPSADIPSVFRQIVSARSHDLELIRECLSNSCAKEVDATLIM